MLCGLHYILKFDEAKVNYTLHENGINYDKGGIVRFMVFTGKTKVYLNKPTDRVDNSPITVRKRYTDQHIELRTRLRDVSGRWTKDYNSIYEGVVKLSDGSFNQHRPLWVFKDYSQQVPLSYHFLTIKKTIKKDNTDEYMFSKILIDN